MHKILIVAKREYLALVATKGFLIGLALMPVLMGGGAIIPNLLHTRVDTIPKKVVVLDASHAVGSALQTAAEMRNKDGIFGPDGKQTEPAYLVEVTETDQVSDQAKVDLSQRIRRREIYAFVEIPAGILEPQKAGDQAPPQAGFYADGATLSDVKRWFERTIEEVVRAKRLQQAGLDPGLVRGAMAPVPVEGFGLLQQAADGKVTKAESTDRAAAVFVPMGIMLMMFMLMWMSAQPSLESIMEEKLQRISEVLLGSIKPFQWMLGKLLGSVAGSLTTMSLYFVAALAMTWHYDVLDRVPWHIMPWFIAFQILGVILFSSIFMAIGAASNSSKDAQGLLMPILLFLLIPMFVWFNVIRDPSSALSIGLSFYPPATPMIMILRMTASSTIPWWQPVASMLAMLVSTSACVFAAARIFRIGVLTQGHSPKLHELARWVVYG